MKSPDAEDGGADDDEVAAAAVVVVADFVAAFSTPLSVPRLLL